MARSSTSFKPGNKSAFKGAFGPGNKLAVRHGAYSRDVLSPLAEAIAEKVRLELQAQPHTLPVDLPLIDSFAFVTAAARRMEDHFLLTGNGTLLTDGGKPRAGADFYLRAVRTQMDLAKVLGVGALPRAQTMQAAAGAGKDHYEVEAARARMRARLGLPASDKTEEKAPPLDS